LFLHVFQWPPDGRLIVPGLKTKVTRARLDRAGKLAVTSSGDNVVITLPPGCPDTLIPVVTLELAGPAEASRDQFVLNRCRQTLETGVAKLEGCGLKAVNWMEKFGDWKHAECIADWQGAESAATWEFKTVEPGSFYLDVEYTCPAEDDYSEWRVRCGATAVAFPLIDTGERPTRVAFGVAFPRFRTYRVGVLDLPKPGRRQLCLGPTGSEGKGVRISSLNLAPVE
jgi:alpha-L-fucosidase